MEDLKKILGEIDAHEHKVAVIVKQWDRLTEEQRRTAVKAAFTGVWDELKAELAAAAESRLEEAETT